MADQPIVKIGELRARIEELTSLDVQTFTGKLSAEISTPEGGPDETSGNLVDWTKLLKAARAGGQVFLAASTRVKVAGDTVQFFETGVDPKVLQAHDAAVKAAQEMRRGIIAMFRDILDGKK